MAEGTELPQKGGPLLRWGIANLAWILPLITLEQLAQGEWQKAAAFGVASAVDIAVGAKIHVFSEIVRRWRPKMPNLILIAIGLCGALALGIAIGGWVIRWPQSVGDTASGRITWDFDNPAPHYFLGLNGLNDQESRIVGFQAHGKNTSADPITEFSGYIRSDLTNEKRPIYLMAQDATKHADRPAYLMPDILPTAPDQTFGIPGLAEFAIQTYDKGYIESGVDGIAVSVFLRDFGPFTLVLNYDGKTVERHFTLDQIKEQLVLFEKSRNPQSANSPRVMRKQTAPHVATFPAHLVLPPQPAQQAAPAPAPQAGGSGNAH